MGVNSGLTEDGEKHHVTTPISPTHHRVEIAGRNYDLPIVAINPTLAIALLMMIDEGVRFGEHVGRALAGRMKASRPDIVVGTATLGIPVAIETTRHLGLDRYVITQKSPKIHLADALTEPVRSITSDREQKLMLDRRAVPMLAGKRVAIVDDVASTGSSLAATCALVRRAGGIIAALGVVLTEAHDWKKNLGEDAKLLVALGHIPVFKLDGAAATVIPETV